jgi:hypothetical protein
VTSLSDCESFSERVNSWSGSFWASPKTFVDLLPLPPFIGGRTDDPTIRRLVVTPYSYWVFYEIGDDVIVIHKRDLQNVLERRVVYG